MTLLQRDREKIAEGRAEVILETKRAISLVQSGKVTCIEDLLKQGISQEVAEAIFQD